MMRQWSPFGPGFRLPPPRHGNYDAASPARKARIQSAPMPTVADYEAWLASAHCKLKPSRRTKLDGRSLHRAVSMRRGGSAASEVAEAIGISTSAVTRWLSELPDHLSHKPASDTVS